MGDPPFDSRAHTGRCLPVCARGTDEEFQSRLKDLLKIFELDFRQPGCVLPGEKRKQFPEGRGGGVL